jgi:hypothetical protein
LEKNFYSPSRSVTETASPSHLVSADGAAVPSHPPAGPVVPEPFADSHHQRPISLDQLEKGMVPVLHAVEIEEIEADGGPNKVLPIIYYTVQGFGSQIRVDFMRIRIRITADPVVPVLFFLLPLYCYLEDLLKIIFSFHEKKCQKGHFYEYLKQCFKI